MSELDVTYRPVEASPMEAKLGFTPGPERPETHFADNLAGLGAVVGTAYGGQKDHALEEAKLDISANNGLRTEEQKQRPFWSPVTDQDLTNLEVAHGADALKAQNHIDMVNHIDKSPEQYKQHLAAMGKTTSAASQNPEWFSKRFNADTEELTKAQENLHYHYNAEKEVGLMTNLLGLPLVELQQNIMTLPPGTDPSVKEAMGKRALDVVASRLNDPKHSGAAHLALHAMVTQGLTKGDPTMYNTVQQMVSSGLVPKENLDGIPDLEMAKEKYKQSSGNQLSALKDAILQAQTQQRTEDVTRLTAQYYQLATVAKSTGIQLEPYAQSILDSEFNSLSYNADKVHEQEMMQEQEHAHTTTSQQEHFLKKAGEARINGDDKAAANYEQMAAQSNQVYNERTKVPGLNPAVTKAEPYINKYNIDDDNGPALDPLLIKALIQQESGGSSSAVSSAGATGVMQLMPDTATRFGVTDRKDPAQNIRGGIEYLKFLSKKFNGNIDLILAGYNAGENAVIKYHNTIPPYHETQDYVRIIKANYRNLQKHQNTAEAQNSVNTHFGTTKDSVAESVALAQYSETNADTINALKSGTLSTEQIMAISPELKRNLDKGNFPEKAKLKAKTEIVKLLTSATHKAVDADLTTLQTQISSGDADGVTRTTQTLLAAASSGNLQYTQVPAYVKALNNGIAVVAKDGRVEDAIALQATLKELAPESSGDENLKVISQAQADARKPAWISQREKSFQDNLPAIAHALGGPRKITSQRDAYEALLPEDQKHLLDDVNTADYYSTILQVPGVDKNRLHQIYSLISGNPSHTRVKAALEGIPEIDPGTRVPLAAYTNEKWLKAFEAQEQTKDPGFSAENIPTETVNRLLTQQGSPQLGSVLENIVELNQRGEMPLGRDPENLTRLATTLAPQITLSDSGVPEIKRVQALGSKNASAYQKLTDQSLIIAANGGSPVQFIQDQASVNAHWERADYGYQSGDGKQNDPTGWAMSNNYVKSLSDKDRGEFMRMWDIGKTINAKPMEQFNLTLRAFESVSPTYKGIKVRGSLPTEKEKGSVQRLSQHLKAEGNGSDDIQKLLTSVPVQRLIKEHVHSDTPDNLGTDWTWNVTENLTLQGFRPGKGIDERPLEIPKAEWQKGTIEENNSYPSWFAPSVEDAKSPGDWVHKTLLAHDAQHAKHIKFWSTAASNAVSDLEPKDVAEASLKSLQTVLGIVPSVANAAGKDVYEFGRDVVAGAPVKVVPPRKELSTVTTITFDPEEALNTENLKAALKGKPSTGLSWADRDQRNEDDYDMAAYKKAYPKAAPKGEEEHYTDEFKQPWHPTFSTDSTAHGGDKKGGKWVKLPDGSDQFQPSAFNLSQFSPDYYENYFKTVETKTASVLLPDGRVIKGTK